MAVNVGGSVEFIPSHQDAQDKDDLSSSSCISSGCRVAPRWPHRMACLQRLAGTDPVSLRSWSVQRARGRPGRRLQSGPHQVNNRMLGRLGNVGHCVLEVGTPWVSRAMWMTGDWKSKGQPANPETPGKWRLKQLWPLTVHQTMGCQTVGLTDWG